MPSIYFLIDIADLVEIGMNDSEFEEYSSLQRNYCGNSPLPVGTNCIFDEINTTIKEIIYWADENRIEMALTLNQGDFHEMMLASLKNPANKWVPCE